jgi:hypothetical protein
VASASWRRKVELEPHFAFTYFLIMTLPGRGPEKVFTCPGREGAQQLKSLRDVKSPGFPLPKFHTTEMGVTAGA